MKGFPRNRKEGRGEQTGPRGGQGAGAKDSLTKGHDMALTPEGMRRAPTQVFLAQRKRTGTQNKAGQKERGESKAHT